jgi:protein FrlC
VFVLSEWDMTQVLGMNAHYLHYSLDYFLEIQKELGIRQIEMWAAPPHYLFDDQSPGNSKALLRLLSAKGISAPVFTPPWNNNYPLCAYDEQVRNHSFSYYQNAILAGKSLGAGILVCACYGGNWEEKPEQTFAHGIEMLKKLAPFAEKAEITLAVECGPPAETRGVNTLLELRRLIEQVGHSRVKAALSLTAIRAADESLDDWFSVFRKDIVHVHFSDGRPWGRLVWGDGLFPMDEYWDILAKWGYKGYISLPVMDGCYEDDPALADRRNMAALREILNR